MKRQTKLIIKAQTSEMLNPQAFHDMFVCAKKAVKVSLIPHIGFVELNNEGVLERCTHAEMVEAFDDAKLLEHLDDYTYFEVLPAPPAKTKIEEAGPKLLAALEEIVTTGYFNEDSGSKARMLIQELK